MYKTGQVGEKYSNERKQQGQRPNYQKQSNIYLPLEY